MNTIVEQISCRACLCSAPIFHSFLEHVAGQSIYDMFATLLPQLQMKPGENGMPELICAICLNKLSMAYEFQQMCIVSDKRLHSQLLTKVSEAKKIPDAKKQQLVSCIKLEDLISEENCMVDDTKQNCCESVDAEAAWTDSQNKDPLHKKQSVTYIKLEDLISEENWVVDEISNNEISCAAQDVKQNCCELVNAEAVWSESDESSVTSTRLRRSRSKSIEESIEANTIEKSTGRCKKNDRFPCTICGKDFDRKYQLQRHLNVHSKERAFACDRCTYRFATASNLACHMPGCKSDELKLMQHHIPPPAAGYKCRECPRRFQKNESLAAHSQVHRKAKPGELYKCEYCTKAFKKSSQLGQHKRTHPENHLYKCQQCEKSFALRSHLKNHLNKHEGIKPYACDFCDKSFLQNNTLKQHLRTHTGEKPYLCPQCGKAFLNGSGLRQHLLRHTGEKRYQCPECPSKFACLSDQIKHKAIHKKLKPHVCDTCGASFTRLYTLTQHKFKHKGQRPHKCQECHMTFVFIDHLRRHLRTHTGEKPYKCKYCGRAYAESGDLNKHLRIHVGEKTYKCEQCPEAFKYLNDLRDHNMEHYKAQQADQNKIEKPNTENEVAVE